MVSDEPSLARVNVSVPPGSWPIVSSQRIMASVPYTSSVRRGKVSGRLYATVWLSRTPDAVRALITAPSSTGVSVWTRRWRKQETSWIRSPTSVWKRSSPCGARSIMAPPPARSGSIRQLSWSAWPAPGVQPRPVQQA